MYNIYNRCLAITGLIFIAIGTGGIKPCVYTFGGDQFQLPEQQDQLTRFFNRFITAIYIGALISTFSTPELRRNVQCFGRDSCYPLAFGVLSLLMIASIGTYINKITIIIYCEKMFDIITVLVILYLLPSKHIHLPIIDHII